MMNGTKRMMKISKSQPEETISEILKADVEDLSEMP